MADNPALPATGQLVATDDIGGVQYQIIKPAFGALDSATLVSATNPLPTAYNDPDVVASGTIIATDAVVAAPAGGGALVAGASTAGSLVAAACPGGDSAWIAQITGLTSGTLYFEESLDSTNGTDGNWVNVNGRQTGIVNTVLAGNATTNGVWRGNTSGAKQLRIRAVGALSGTPAIVIRLSGGTGAIFLNASIPTGSNSIGAVDTELPAAAALSDTVANPTTPLVGDALMLYDGTQWQRARSAAGGNNTTGGGVMAAALMVWDGSNYQRSASGDANADGLGPFFLQLRTSAELRLWDGSNYTRRRGVTIIKNIAAVSVTAGTAVTIWTPTTGKKFRVMGYVLGSSIAGGIILVDGATEFMRFLAAAGQSYPAPGMDNGYLSSAANNLLKVNVTVTGVISGYVYGTEEG